MPRPKPFRQASAACFATGGERPYARTMAKLSATNDCSSSTRLEV